MREQMEPMFQEPNEVSANGTNQEGVQAQEGIQDKSGGRLKRFFSRKDLPVLVAILALVTSITFNVFQLWGTLEEGKRLRNFEPAGSFQSGELVDSIIEQCSHETDTPPPELKIVADFASYGSFSHPEKFEEYLDLLRRRADNGRNRVSCIFLDDLRREQVLRLQFKDFDTLKKTAPFLERLTRYMVTDYGRRALKELDLENRALHPEDLTLDEWVQIGIRVDDLVIKDLRQWGVGVKFYPHLLTVHAWSGSRNQALMAIVDFEGVVDEAGFIARGDIAGHIRKIFEIVDKGAKP